MVVAVGMLFGMAFVVAAAAMGWGLSALLHDLFLRR